MCVGIFLMSEWCVRPSLLETVRGRWPWVITTLRTSHGEQARKQPSWWSLHRFLPQVPAWLSWSCRMKGISFFPGCSWSRCLSQQKGKHRSYCGGFCLEPRCFYSKMVGGDRETPKPCRAACLSYTVLNNWAVRNDLWLSHMCHDTYMNTLTHLYTKGKRKIAG